MPETIRYRNVLLNHLGVEDIALLQPHLTAEVLALRRRLAEADRKIERVYFLESGIASIVSHVRHAVPIEIGIIGREGVTNLPVLMGTDRSPSQTFMQLSGTGFSIDADRLREAMEQSPSLSLVLVRFAHVYMMQVGSTVLANGRGTVTERLSRWLLMAHDRIDGDNLNLTHEFLAVMLGVRRSGVTVALQHLKQRGLTSNTRGQVRITDRAGLETAANGYYGTSESEFVRLFGARS